MEPVGEILFMLVVLAGVAFLLYRGCRSVWRLFKGQPPCHCDQMLPPE